MNDDVIFNQFDEIEEKVEFLIELCKSLEKSNADLKSKITVLEKELDEKSSYEERFETQKEKIRKKIDGLINRLNSYSELN